MKTFKKHSHHGSNETIDLDLWSITGLLGRNVLAEGFGSPKLSSRDRIAEGYGSEWGFGFRE